MKKIIYNTFTILGSLILHYAAFAENIVFFQIVCFTLCTCSLLVITFSTYVRDALIERCNNNSLLDWCSALAMVGTNLYITHHNKTYFYFYLLSNIVAYAIILGGIFSDNKNNNNNDKK